MLRVRPAGVRLGIERLDAHQPHEPLNALAVDPAALPTEMQRHRAAAVEGSFQILLVDQTHELQLLGINRLRLIIKRRTADIQQLALP